MSERELDLLMGQLKQLKIKLQRYAWVKEDMYKKDERFSLESATLTIGQCIELVRMAEELEFEQLLKSTEALREKQNLVSKIQHFDCPFENLTDYVALFRKARSKLAGSLTHLWRDTCVLSTTIKRTIKTLRIMQQWAHTKRVSEEKGEVIKHLDEVFKKYHQKYLGYTRKLNHMAQYVDQQTDDQQDRYLELATMKKYLTGETDIFTNHEDYSDEEFLSKMFGEHYKNDTQFKEILRNSLKQVARQRGFEVEHIDVYRRHVCEYHKELNRLKDIVENLVANLEQMDYTTPMSNINEVHKADMELHCIKKYLQDIFVEGTPAF